MQTDDFTEREVRAAFLWSKMEVEDQVQSMSYQRMSFVDFVEALGRIADMKLLPCDAGLPASQPLNPTKDPLSKRYASLLSLIRSRLRGGGGEPGAADAGPAHTER